MAPLILSIETATLGGSVSLSQGAELVAACSGDPRVSHSHSLLRDIDRLLSKNDIALADIDLFAAAIGPGSFTGLRIGIATLKGLAATFNRPCVGVPTLQAIAHAAGASDATVALLPAGRGEVFAQLFRVTAAGRVTELDAASHISPTKMLEKYAGLANVCWAGQGAYAYLERIQEFAKRNGQQIVEAGLGPAGWRLASNTPNLAVHVGVLAFAKAELHETVTPSGLRAFYVRPSDAELKQKPTVS